MSPQDQRAEADRRFEETLARTGARDPREFYRQRLRELRGRDATRYAAAVEYFESRLIPAVAQADSDPLREWMEYGRYLATLVAEGRTVRIDPSGLAVEYEAYSGVDDLVLHLPAAGRDPALVVGLPARLSPAQRATYDLLVGGERES